MQFKKLCRFKVTVKISDGFYQSLHIDIHDEDQYGAKKTLVEYIKTTAFANCDIVKIELVDIIEYIEK